MSSLVCLQGNIHAHTNFLLTAAKGDIIAVRHAVTHFSKRDYSHSQAEELLIITITTCICTKKLSQHYHLEQY